VATVSCIEFYGDNYREGSPVPFTTVFEYYNHSLRNKIKLYIIHEKGKISAELLAIVCKIQPTTVLLN
jgi:hypothetical protein